MTETIPEVKITMLGKQGAGKTSLSYRFQSDRFDINTAPTIGAAFIAKTIEVGSDKMKIYLWDTAGTERFSSLAPMYIRSGYVVFICFDEVDLRDLAARVRVTEENNPLAKIFLVATKHDQIKDLTPYEAVQTYATEKGFPLYFTSSATYYGIDQLFRDAAIEGNLVGQQIRKTAEKTIKIFDDEAPMPPAQKWWVWNPC